MSPAAEVAAARVAVLEASRAIGRLYHRSSVDRAQIRAWRDEHGTGPVFRLLVLTLVPTLPQLRQLRQTRNEALRTIRRFEDPAYRIGDEQPFVSFLES